MHATILRGLRRLRSRTGSSTSPLISHRNSTLVCLALVGVSLGVRSGHKVKNLSIAPTNRRIYIVIADTSLGNWNTITIARGCASTRAVLEAAKLATGALRVSLTFCAGEK